MEDAERLLDRLRAIAKANSSPTRSQILGKAISTVEQFQYAISLRREHWLSILLTEIIKPFFARTVNPNLTPSGRKNLVAHPPATRLSTSDFLDTDTKPWKKAPWCLDVLKFVVSQYHTSSPKASQQPLTDQHLFLLMPPMLTLIDDIEISYKTRGCELLENLCNAISWQSSNILSRTGLADIFTDSLKTNFMLLPTLTPEDESLALHQQLYPAIRALVIATFPLDPVRAATTTSTPTPFSRGGHSTQSDLSATLQTLTVQDKWNSPRQKMLDMIFRHGILASYNHCATSHIRMATFFIQQATLSISLMHTNATKYLKTLFSVLGSILTNPLGAAYPPLLEAGLTLLQMLLVHCKERIAMAWRHECLRIVIWCFIIVQTDLPRPDSTGDELRVRIDDIVQSLAGMGDEEMFTKELEMLVAADSNLIALLSGIHLISPKSQKTTGIQELSDSDT